MQTDPFKNAVLIVTGLLLLGIAGVSAALYNTGPRVRFLDSDYDASSTALQNQTSIQVRFDRALREDNYQNSIRISPDAEFDVFASGQSLTITFLENLTHNTNYTLTIGPEVFDTNNARMSSAYTHRFSTGQPRYAFLQRNPAGEDHIYTSTLGAPPTSVFTHPTITHFTANDRAIVVATQANTQYSLVILDADDYSVRSTQEFDEPITLVAVGTRSPVALYTLNTFGNDQQRPAHRLYSIDLVSGQTRAIAGLGDSQMQAVNIQPDQAGQYALAQSTDGSFYAVSPYNDYPATLLGSYPTSLGFDSSGSEIIYADNSDLTRLNTFTAKSSSRLLEQNESIQAVTTQQDEFYYSTASTIAGRSRFSVKNIAQWPSGDPSILWTNRSLADTDLSSFSVSYDASLLALQLDPSNCTYDDTTVNPKCLGARTVIYDPATAQDVASLEGFNLVWLP